jgi:hypothetical protein
MTDCTDSNLKLNIILLRWRDLAVVVVILAVAE